MRKFGKVFDSKVDNKFRKESKRILVKDSLKSNKDSLKGRVISSIGKNYLVKSDQASLNPIECIVSGTIESQHDNATLLSVGDYVDFILPEDTINDHVASIVKVYTRQTWLSRKSILGNSEDVMASNSSHLLIIISADKPIYNKRLIDRMIVAGLIGNLKISIGMNKIDLFDEKILAQDLKAYKKMKIPVLYFSAKTGNGMDKLMEFIKDKDTITAGPSGVGKSTIINSIIGKNTQSIGEISEKWNKGKHTTSSSRLFNLQSGGVIIDTPGIREFGIKHIEPDELTLYFHEFYDYYEHCKFMPCSHTHEPGCAVKEAVEKSKIDADRYYSYLNIFESLE